MGQNYGPCPSNFHCHRSRERDDSKGKHKRDATIRNPFPRLGFGLRRGRRCGTSWRRSPHAAARPHTSRFSCTLFTGYQFRKRSRKKKKINLLASASRLPPSSRRWWLVADAEHKPLHAPRDGCVAMASTACIRLPFLPAQKRSAASSSPRHASLKCSATDARASSGANSVSASVDSVDLDGLRRPPEPLPRSAISTARDPRWLHRKSRSRLR